MTFEPVDECETKCSNVGEAMVSLAMTSFQIFCVTSFVRPMTRYRGRKVLDGWVLSEEGYMNDLDGESI